MSIPKIFIALVMLFTSLNANAQEVYSCQSVTKDKKVHECSEFMFKGSSEKPDAVNSFVADVKICLSGDGKYSTTIQKAECPKSFGYCENQTDGYIKRAHYYSKSRLSHGKKICNNDGMLAKFKLLHQFKFVERP